MGDIVNVEISEKGLFVEKPARRRLSEAELLAGITPVTAHADEIAPPFNEEVDY
ncbi:putative programmed cell death antitoxin MazE [Escherichia coli P0299483.1]|nr:putative programmed cell death antitoxin MazE [Escherichia coli P0299483.1]